MASTASLTSLLVVALLSASTLGLLGMAGALAAHSLWRHAPYLAPAYGLLPIGLAGIVVFFAWVLHPTAGMVAGLLVVGVAVAVLTVHGSRLHGQGAVTSLLPAGRRLFGLSLGLLVLTLGLFLLWGGSFDLFYAARERFSHPLPDDNELPSVIASRLLDGSDPRVPMNSWLSSDRPPLQTGLLLLIQGGLAWTPVAEVTLSFAASVVCQTCWVPAVYALIRALGFSPRAALGAAVFTGLSGTILINTVFSWPKLLSAAFVIAALAITADLPGRRSQHARAATIAVAGLATSGILSHGAAFFALPVLAVLMWWSRRSLSVAGLAAGGCTALVLYAPWLAYQRLYDPPGDRLLKWHLAGVQGLTDTPLLTSLVDAYRDLSPGTVIEYKIANLAVPLGLRTPAELRSLGILHALRAEQFFSMVGALSLAVLPLGLMLVAAARHRWRSDPGPTPATRAAGVMVACGAAVVLWCLILFGPGATWVHQGSHVPIILATCLPMAWLIDRNARWAVLVGAAQLGLLAVLYVPHNYPGFPALFSGRAALSVLLALALLLWVLRTAGGGGTATGGVGPADPARHADGAKERTPVPVLVGGVSADR